jgi:Tol biopolymer transport system component
VSTNSFERICVDSVGTPATTVSYGGSLSADGRFVAFTSQASLAGDGESLDVFVRDRQEQTTRCVVINRDGLIGGNGESRSPAISLDGRFVAYVSQATDLTDDEPPTQLTQLFVYDLEEETTRRITVGLDGTGGDALVYRGVHMPGRFMAFDSSATNLVAADTNGVSDIFVAPVR